MDVQESRTRINQALNVSSPRNRDREKGFRVSGVGDEAVLQRPAWIGLDWVQNLLENYWPTFELKLFETSAQHSWQIYLPLISIFFVSNFLFNTL